MKILPGSVFILLAVAGSVYSVTQPPVMLINPPTRVWFYVSETARLPCKASGRPQPTYTWKKDNQDFNMAGSRDRVVMQPHEGTLVFKQPRKEDAGLYQCFAKNPYGVAMSGIVELRFGFLTRYPDQEAETITVSPGASLILSCNKPPSEPEAKMIWVLGQEDGFLRHLDLTERILQDHDGNLVFVNVQEEDARKDAAYTCVAENRFVREMSRGKMTYLKTLPEPPQHHQLHLLSSTPDEVVFLKGDTVKLECVFGGHPTPEVRWNRRSQRIIFSDFNHQLNIPDAGFEDEGEYVCEAIDETRGYFEEKSIRVKIESKPEWTTKPKSIFASEDTSATFICDGTSKPPISKRKWYINGIDIDEYPNKNKFIVEKSNLTVINLTTRDSMTIQCNISNIHGYLFTNVFLNVYTEPPDLLEDKEKTVKHAEGQSTNLTCRTTGGDSVHVRWLKDNKWVIGDRYRTLSNGNLTIKDLVLEDSGVYRCDAINKFGMVSATRTLIVRRKTRIERFPADLSVYEGEDAKFTCVFTTDPMEADNLRVSWMKDDYAVAIDEEERIIQDAKDDSLIISNVTERDAGRYSCVATTGLDSIKALAILRIRNTQPPVVLINPPAQVLFRESEAVVLPCKATGAPQLMYTWKKDNQDFNMAASRDRVVMQPHEGTLEFKQLRKEDAGVYQCFAKNPYGVAMSGIVDLRLALLKPNTDQEPETITVLPGASLLLPCQNLTSHPEADVTWVLKHKDGSLKPFDFTERILMDHQANLVFVNIQEEDSYEDAAYVCVAMNMFRRETSQGKPFYLRTLPMPPENYEPHLLSSTPDEVVFLKGDTVKLECVFGGHPTPEVRWDRRSQRIIFSDFNHQLNIPDAGFEDEGKYECDATEETYGYIELKSIRVKIESKPEWTTKPKSIFASEDTSATFICDGTSKPPISKRKWYINGIDIDEYPNKNKFIVEKSNLTVINLTTRDSMTIQCNISNIHGYLFTNVFLNVYTEPPDLLEDKEKTVKHAEGQSTNLTCRTTGGDSVHVRWLKDNKWVIGDRYRTLSNGNLTIKDLVLEDSGVYRCDAINKFGMVSATRTLIVRRKTRIERFPADLSVYEGEDAKFTCVFTTDPMEADNLRVSWMKDDYAVAIDEEERIIQDAKDDSLIISNVTERDAGRYSCVATTGLDSIKALAILRIRGAQPPVMLINPPAQVLFRESEAVVLPCKASHAPQLMYTWKKDNQDFNMAASRDRVVMQPHEGSLVFKQPRKEDAGMYQCFAKNPYGVAMSGIVDLRLALLKPNTDQEPETITVLPGASLLLPCKKLTSHPEADVTWVLKHKDGSLKPFDFTERILMDHQANLVFVNIQEEDSYEDAAYVCVAMNMFRRETSQGKPFYLRTLPMPPENYEPHLLSPTPDEVVFLKGDTVKLECVFGGHPTPEIHWSRNTKVGRTQLEGLAKYKLSRFNRQLKILNAGFEDEGSYECSAVTPDFNLQQTMMVRIEAKPEWTMKPKNIVTSASSATFVCNGTGKPPINTPMWYINGKRIGEYPNKKKFIVEKSNLTVINLRRRDSMTIQCNISNVHGYLFTNVFLSVHTEAPELLVKENKTLKSSEGQSINITCKTTQDDSMQVLWSRNNKQMTGDRHHTLSNGNLNIKDLELADSGVYRCDARNKFGTVSAMRRLKVRRKTRIEPSTSDKWVKVGKDATFSCAVTTDPLEVDNLQILWFKDGKAIDIEKEGVIHDTRNNSLTIKRVVPGKDDGRYSCVATNGLDWAKMSTSLYIKSPRR